MTETTQIEAGRELDALVAQYVMGWTPWLEQRGQYRHVVWQTDPNREPWKRSQDDAAQRQRYSEFRVEDFDPMRHIMTQVGDTFRPSTTGDGMLAVLERMRALDWTWELGEWSFGPAAPGTPHTAHPRAWGATLTPFDDGDDRVVVAAADTLPHAVCLAALEAVRG